MNIHALLHSHSFTCPSRPLWTFFVLYFFQALCGYLSSSFSWVEDRVLYYVKTSEASKRWYSHPKLCLVLFSCSCNTLYIMWFVLKHSCMYLKILNYSFTVMVGYQSSECFNSSIRASIKQCIHEILCNV